jgi:hypothetical protein
MKFGKVSVMLSTSIFSPSALFSFISETHSTHDGMLEDKDVLIFWHYLLNGCWLYCIAFAIFLGLCFWAFHSDH